MVGEHLDELRLDGKLVREQLQVVGQPLVLGDDDALAVHVELRPARTSEDLHHVEHLPRDMGRYGEIQGDVGRSGETWGDVGRCGEMWGDLHHVEHPEVDEGALLRVVDLGYRVRVGVGVGSGPGRARVRAAR